MAAPTIRLGSKGGGGGPSGGPSAASAAPRPSMFAADLQPQQEPTVQKWEWLYQHLWRKGAETRGDVPPLQLLIADTVILSPTSELQHWLFTAKDGRVRRKNPDKLTAHTVREAFERAALVGAFNTNSFTTVVRRSGGEVGAQLLDQKSMLDLSKDSADLSGIVLSLIHI